jgi:pSer/pThr/pTyr-binding forkhead associated (FHA) protein
MAVRAFLELPNATAVRIGAGGLLVGRHHHCDLQLSDPSASRRHALVRVLAEGVEIVVLGRTPVLVDDEPCAAVHCLVDGARLAFPGLACKLRVESFDDAVPLTYGVRRGRDRILVRSSPLVIGSGANSHVAIPGWPDGALRLSIVQGALYVELAGEPGLRNGEPIASDAPTAVVPGDILEVRGETLIIEHAPAGDASTVVPADAEPPTAAMVYPLPRGGRIVFTFRDRERAVYLPGRRFQLLWALLEPPPPHAAGELVPDSELVDRVWEDDPALGGRGDLNVVVMRCRKDLLAAGISAERVLERARGGGATRIRLAPGARVTVASE